MAKRRTACRLDMNPTNKRRIQARFAHRGWRNAVPGRLERLERREMLDGTAYTASMLVDANSSGNAYPVDEVNVGSKLFFFTTADTNFANSRSPSPDPASLWVTDGTSAGTQQLTANLTLLPPYLGPTQFDVNGNLLFFASAFGSSGSSAYPELWISDGTVAGTHELADIQEAFGAPGYWNVGYSVVAGNELYFELFASDGYPWGTLMESDGTAAGTMPVPDPAGGPVTVVSGPVIIGDTIYMITRDNTFFSVTDGVPTEQDGWTAVYDDPVIIGQGSDNPVIIGQAGNSILYQNFGAGQNKDLGVSDGMPTGPNQNDDDGPPDYFGIYGLTILGAIPAPLNNRGVFIVTDGAGYESIWATDGTVAGTTMLGPAPPLGEMQFLAPNDQPHQDGQPVQYVVDGKAFAELSTPTDTQLWVTDGTSGGTSMLQEFSDAPDLRFLGAVGGQYLFISSPPNDGTATLWGSDGVGGGLVQLANMNSPTLKEAAVVDGGAIIFEMGGSSINQLWQTDGTVAGTSQLPINNNTFLANIGGYAIFDGGLQDAKPVVFAANGAPNGTFQITSPSGDWSMGSASPPKLIDDQPTALEDQFLVAGSPDGGPVEPWIIAPATSVTVKGGLTLSGAQGITLSDQTLATFTDPNGDDPLSSYSADIQWGDGRMSTATITGPDDSGVFTVTGSHLYADDADSPFKISIVIHRAGSPDAGINDTAKIATTAPVTYNSSGGNVTVTVSNGNLEILAGTSVMSSTPLSEVTSVTINGVNRATNNFTLDYSDGTFLVPGGITFNGGDLPATPSNSLSIVGGNFDTDTFNFSTSHNGSIQFGTRGQVVNYTNMTPLVNTGTATHAVFTLPDGAVTASLDAGQTSGTVQLVSGNGTFETTTFATPNQSLTINAGKGSDTVTTTNAFYNNFNAVLSVQGAANTLPLHVTGAGTLSATGGTALTDALATFIDPNGADPVSEYSATINWGDGTTDDSGSVTFNGGVFTVSGSHIYTAGGIETATITIHHIGVSPDVSVQEAVAVTQAGVNGSGTSITGTPGTAVSAATVATFTDGDGTEPAGDFTATVDWGDGQTSAGTVSESGDTYSVVGSHTYANAGSFSTKITISEEGNATVLDGSAAIGSNVAASQEYVAAVFQDVLGRGTDPAGLQYWTQQLLAGMPISNVAQAIVHSAEYYQKFVVQPDYLMLLGRPADAAGIQFWTSQLQNGLTDQGLEAGFISADEFYNKAGGTDKDWIDAVYQLLLGRPADAAGESFWEGELSSGMSRSQAALEIAGSTENNTQLINADYFHYLGRAADQGGLTFWLDQFASGATNEDVIAGFTGSAEYYKQHTS